MMMQPKLSRASGNVRIRMLVAIVGAITFTLTTATCAEPLGLKSGVAVCVGDREHRTAGRTNTEATKEAVELTAWIEAQTHWTVHGVPQIQLIPLPEIEKRFTAEEPTNLTIKAFYSYKDHTVYLPDSWRPDDLRDRSILLHELVHHMQFLNKIKETCKSESEFQAYRLQMDWLSEHDVEYPLELVGINPYFLLMLAQCDEMSF